MKKVQRKQLNHNERFALVVAITAYGNAIDHSKDEETSNPNEK